MRFGMALTTWPDVQRHLAARYEVRPERAGRIDVVVPVGGESVALEVSRAEVRASSWVRVASVVGSLRHLSHLELLLLNADATVGAYATRDGEVIVRHQVPLGALRAADLDETIRDVAQLAAWLRGRIAQLGAPPAWTLPGARKK
jgi:hypothetical protein